MKEIIKESDLYEPLKNHFEKLGGEVFSEVIIHGRRADMIVKLNNNIIIVEMKTSITLKLLEQAWKWKGYANMIYVAIPSQKYKNINPYAYYSLKRDNIGLFEVDLQTWRYIPEPKVYEEIASIEETPRRRIDWDNTLKEEHKTMLKSGSSGGGYVTDYKLTIKAVKEYMSLSDKWVTIDEILLNVNTHYRSPKNSLRKALIDFENNWCETTLIKNRRYFRIIKEK